MFKKVFVRGLLTIAPVAVTLAIVIWLFNTINTFFYRLFIDFFGPRFYFPGLGLILAVVTVFIIGILMGNWFIKKLYELFEKLLNKMPLVKTIYQSIVDLISFFKQDNSAMKGAVVMISFAGTKMLGFISRENFDDLPKGIGAEDDVAVFIPMSYQIGGVTVMVPRSMVHKVDMSIEDGLRFAATAGMPGQQNKNKKL